MSKKKYDPLPQFSESDSDIDIFNAKGGISQNPKRRSLLAHRQADCSNKKFYILVALLIVLVVVIAAAVAFSNMKRRNRKGFVTTKAGTFQGSQEVFHKTVSYKFKGIPYAEPPIGDLRWKPPLPKKKLPGTYVADKSYKRCIQYQAPPINVPGEPSEDCLYLNIHTPALGKDAKLPVFVWLHGGYLLNGFADMTGYHPDGQFAVEMNVVGVSISYRLNAFGFLTLEELWQKNKSYGNFGIRDQILALQWIKDNIQNFGGDPNSVTISGQSSGGTSIYALLTSPLADGLFHKAIPMSGSPNFPRNYSVAAKDNRIFLNKTKCQNLTEKIEIKDCMYSLSSSELVKSIPGFEYPYWAMTDLLDFPKYDRLDGSLLVIDPVVLPVAPKDVYTLADMKSNVAVLIGNTAQEPGIGPARNFNTSVQLSEFLSAQLAPFKSVTAEDVFKAYQNVTTYVSSNITAQYLYETIVTDSRTTCASNVLAKDFQKSPRLKNTYRYVVAWKPQNPVDLGGGMFIHNAPHVIDAIALFGYKWWSKGPITKSERAFMTSIREVFGNFIRKGEINGAKPGQTIVYKGDGDVEVLKGEYHEEQCKIWSDPSNGFLPYAWIN